MNQPPDLTPSADVCAHLHIDRSTLTRWVASGRIRAAIKLPGPRGAYLFDPAEVARVRSEITRSASE